MRKNLIFQVSLQISIKNSKFGSFSLQNLIKICSNQRKIEKCIDPEPKLSQSILHNAIKIKTKPIKSTLKRKIVPEVTPKHFKQIFNLESKNLWSTLSIFSPKTAWKDE